MTRHASVVAIALTMTPATSAARTEWTGAGVPVCTAAGVPGNVRSVSDGAGGAYVAWTDPRLGSTNTDLYLQRLDANGNVVAGWPANGFGACKAPGNQQLADLVADGTGGAILVWEDYRSNLYADIYAQRVNPDHSIAWVPDGIVLSAGLNAQRAPRAVADGSGGAFVVWPDSRAVPATLTDIYATHVLAGGTIAPGWDPDGSPVTTSTSDDNSPALVADGSGGMYAAWVHDNNGDPDIWAQHLDDHGVNVSGWPVNGAPIASGTGDQTGVKLVPGGGGTALAVWRDTRTSLDYYALRFGPGTSPAAGWTANGQFVYGSANGKQAPFVTSDSLGGAILAWGELVSPTNEDLFALHLNGNGQVVTSLANPDGIVQMCSDSTYQDPSWLAPDGAGGALLGWTDYRPAAPGAARPAAYVQHFASGATLATGWPAGGVPVATGAAPQTSPVPLSDGAGGAIVAWTLSGGTGAADLYASRVGSDGTVPTLASLVSATVRDGRAVLEWRVAGAAGSAFAIQRSPDGATWTTLAERAPEAGGVVVFEDAGPPTGARSGYRLAALDGAAVAGSETWIEWPRMAALAIRSARLNAAASEAEVRCTLAGDEPATLRLLDAQGRQRAELRVTGRGEHVVTLAELAACAPGVYWLRLEQGERDASVKLAVVK